MSEVGRKIGRAQGGRKEEEEAYWGGGGGERGSGWRGQGEENRPE